MYEMSDNDTLDTVVETSGSDELTQDLLTLNRLVGGSRGPEDVLGGITTYLAGRLDVPGCSCYSVVRESLEPRLVCRADAFRPERVGTSLNTADIAPTVQALFAPAAIGAGDSTFGHPPGAISTNFDQADPQKRGLIVPLVFRKQVVGVQWLAGSTRPLNASEVALAQSAGIFAGQAIGLQIHEQIQEESERDLTSLHDSQLDMRLSERLVELRERESDVVGVFLDAAHRRIEAVERDVQVIAEAVEDFCDDEFAALRRSVDQLKALFATLGSSDVRQTPALHGAQYISAGEAPELPKPDGPGTRVSVALQPVETIRMELHDLIAVSAARGMFTSVIMLGCSNLTAIAAGNGRDRRELWRVLTGLLCEAAHDKKTVGSWSEDTLICILPAASSYAARLVANRLLQEVRGIKFEGIQPKLHIGVASMDPRYPVTTAELLDRVEKTLESAKKLGGSQVVVAAPPGPSAVIGQKRIMIVDDDRTVLRSLKRLFRKVADTDVVTCNSVAEAIESARKTPPQVAILDLKLSDGTGFELLRRLRRVTGSEFPAIAYTGMADQRIRDQAAVVGFNACLLKGEVVALNEEVRRALAD